MNKFHCPVCKKPLTKNEFERALGILDEQKRHFEHEKGKLLGQVQAAKIQARTAREEGIQAERDRNRRLLQGKDQVIQSLKERIRQIKSGSTPQTEGLEFEEQLAARLKREFPEDEVIPKGQGGDVLHIVKLHTQNAGIIIYECKRGPRIESDHIRQAQRAKQSREADFAVLVSTGRMRGFNGLVQKSGVLVVSPLGAIPLATLLRTHLIEMLKAKVTKEKRVVIAQILMKYIASPQFRNPIEEVIHLSTELQDMIKAEAKEHYRIWKKRWNLYQTIHWDGTLIRDNVQLVLHGKEPKAVASQKNTPLQLPAPG